MWSPGIDNPPRTPQASMLAAPQIEGMVRRGISDFERRSGRVCRLTVVAPDGSGLPGSVRVRDDAAGLILDIFFDGATESTEAWLTWLRSDGTSGELSDVTPALVANLVRRAGAMTAR
jgi:hypothetical protein